MFIEPEDLYVRISAKREILVNVINEEKKEAIMSYFQIPHIKQKVRNIIFKYPYTDNKEICRRVVDAMNSVFQTALIMEVE